MRFFVFTFSEQLRNECKAYFKEICGIEISDETAELYLNSLADLYGAMKNLLTDKA